MDISEHIKFLGVSLAYISMQASTDAADAGPA